MISYKDAGVDIDKADSLVRAIKQMAESTRRPGCLGSIGSFGGFFALAGKYKKPVLVSSCDGVGTKLKIAILANIHNTVGIDLVAMSVNDCLCSGAEPLFFLDYIATGKIEQKVLTEVVIGITSGCKEAGCALIGGETAEMPGFYQEGEYDLSGFCVAAAEEGKIINGSTIKLRDKVIGIASSGLHSNGFSLVRKVFAQEELVKRAAEFLTPTRIYVRPVLALTKRAQPQIIKGIAHITGGAFIDKIPRIIPEGMAVQIRAGSWPVPGIFKEIQERAGLDTFQMLRTLNMGIGMVLVVASQDSAGVIKFLQEKFDLLSWEIGEIVKGARQVEIC